MIKHPQRIFYITFTVFALVSCLFFQAKGALEWNVLTVDPTHPVSMPVLALDSVGNPHISYYDETSQNLKYAKWTGTSWNIQNVEPAGSGYDVSDLALDGNNVPHILYSKYSGGQLRYAALNGSTWNIQTITQPSWVDSPGIATDKFGNLHIIFRSQLVLKYAKLVGSSWNITTVDTEGLNGYGNCLVIDSAGNPRISYIGYGNEQQQPVRYAKWTGSEWNIQTVDATGIGFYTSLACDSDGNPHISYSYKPNQTATDLSIKYAKWVGAAWDTKNVSSTGTGYGSSIVLGSGNIPQICYDTYYTGTLVYANWTGSNWNTQTVDGDFANWGSMVLHSTGNPRISFSGGAGLRYAELIDPSVTPPIPEFTAFVMMSTFVITSILFAMIKGLLKSKSRRPAKTLQPLPNLDQDRRRFAESLFMLEIIFSASPQNCDCCTTITNAY